MKRTRSQNGIGSKHHALGGVSYELVYDDGFEWMVRRSANSVHAIVTDPPYGLREYTPKEKDKTTQWKGRRVADSAVV